MSSDDREVTLKSMVESLQNLQEKLKTLNAHLTTLAEQQKVNNAKIQEAAQKLRALRDTLTNNAKREREPKN